MKKAVRSNKVYFDKRSDAIKVAEQRRTQCWKVKHGRHKGEYFVGSHLEFISFH